MNRHKEEEERESGKNKGRCTFGAIMRDKRREEWM
jgi:hypothetical protein